MVDETTETESSAEAVSPVDVIVMRKPSLTGEYHTDCNALMKRIEELEWALKDARVFSELVEIWGRTDCEIYKHELKASADLSLERIDNVIGA